MKKLYKLVIFLVLGSILVFGLPPLLTRGQDGNSDGRNIFSVLNDFVTYIPIIGKDEITLPTATATPPNMPPFPTNTSVIGPPNATNTPTYEPKTPTPTNGFVTSTPTTTNTPNPVPGDMIWVDHNSVALFDSIPTEYLEAAKNLRMLFSDRSVGVNINEAIDCFAAPSWAQSSNGCRKDYYSIQGPIWLYRLFNQEDLDQGLVPDRILFEPDPAVYDRSNWTFIATMGSWSGLTEEFINVIAPQYINSKDVLGYQFSYLNVLDGDNISDPESGYFADTPYFYDVYDYEEYIAQHPDKIFIFWTTSLARAIGNQVSMDFNDMMRQYAIENHKILFDVADIEAHTDLGASCYDHRDGVEYCDPNGGGCENFPDDGFNYPAICQDWTTEINGGHLSSVSGGRIQIAKAFWVLMAQIAGWVP